MKRQSILLALLCMYIATAANAQSNFQQDRKAILALGGFYKVSYAYTETFAPDTAYRYHLQYHASGYEWAIVEQETPKKIVIQHLLVTGDSSVIKHWREDWVYEEPRLLVYDKDNRWKTITLNQSKVKGRWVQKVYQVDDSPRYESIGTWIHVDGRDEWHSECDSPLPRREFTKRKDYNVLRRGNRIYLTPNGWMFEQDNKKIIRGDAGDKLLASEKGYEEFIRADSNKFVYAQSWWYAQRNFWTTVREVWDETYTANDTIHLKSSVSGKLLFEQLFDLADQSVKEKWAEGKIKDQTRRVIGLYLDQSI